MQQSTSMENNTCWKRNEEIGKDVHGENKKLQKYHFLTVHKLTNHRALFCEPNSIQDLRTKDSALQERKARILNVSFLLTKKTENYFKPKNKSNVLTDTEVSLRNRQVFSCLTNKAISQVLLSPANIFKKNRKEEKDQKLFPS